MKNIYLSSILIFSSSFIHAETITFKTQAIQKSKNPFTGNIPYIQGKGFEQINRQIKRVILKDDGTPIEFESDELYQDDNYLSIRVNQEISGGRTYYRSKYFVIDLKNKKIMTLDQIIKKYQLSTTDISRQIGKELEPYIFPKTPITEECNCADMHIYIEIMPKINRVLI